jgi:hypothetical protein
LADKLREVLDSVGDAADFFGVELKDVNQRGMYGNTPLKVATVRGDVGAVRVLPDTGAEVDAVVEEDAPVSTTLLGSIVRKTCASFSTVAVRWIHVMTFLAGRLSRWRKDWAMKRC